MCVRCSLKHTFIFLVNEGDLTKFISWNFSDVRGGGKKMKNVIWNKKKLKN